MYKYRCTYMLMYNIKIRRHRDRHWRLLIYSLTIHRWIHTHRYTFQSNIPTHTHAHTSTVPLRIYMCFQIKESLASKGFNWFYIFIRPKTMFSNNQKRHKPFYSEYEHGIKSQLQHNLVTRQQLLAKLQPGKRKSRKTLHTCRLEFMLMLDLQRLDFMPTSIYTEG